MSDDLTPLMNVCECVCAFECNDVSGAISLLLVVMMIGVLIVCTAIAINYELLRGAAEKYDCVPVCTHMECITLLYKRSLSRNSMSSIGSQAMCALRAPLDTKAWRARRVRSVISSVRDVRVIDQLRSVIAQCTQHNIRGAEHRISPIRDAYAFACAVIVIKYVDQQISANIINSNTLIVS